MNGQTAGAPLSGGRRILHRETRRPFEIVLMRVVYFVTGAVDALLGFRFVLRLFGASTAAGFTQFIYNSSASLMAPFRTVFGVLRAEGAVFDWSVLLAIAAYTVLGLGVAALIDAVTPRSTATTVETTEENDGDLHTPAHPAA